jgi:hypothetical protein
MTWLVITGGLNGRFENKEYQSTSFEFGISLSHGGLTKFNWL